MRLVSRFVASLVLSVSGVTGCDLATELSAPEVQPLLPEVTCDGLSTGICDRVTGDVGGDVPGVLATVELACDPGPCSRAEGARHARLTYPDGRVEIRPWAYTGDPNPLPDPECLGIEPALCAEMANAHLDSLPLDLHLISVRVTCRGVRGCSRGEGTADVVAPDSLGVPYRSGHSWWDSGPGSTAPPPDTKTPEP